MNIEHSLAVISTKLFPRFVSVFGKTSTALKFSFLTIVTALIISISLDVLAKEEKSLMEQSKNSLLLKQSGQIQNRNLEMIFPGEVDTSFRPVIPLAPRLSVKAVRIQTDGRIIFGGAFGSVNGVDRRNIARLNADGTVDDTFNPGTGALGNSGVQVIAIQTDGKILIGGFFTTYNGVSRVGIARLNSDGSLDTSFNPLLGGSNNLGHDIQEIAIQTDGKILIGGDFTMVNGVSRNGFARLNTDGTIDASFIPVSGLDRVGTIKIQTDDKIIISGSSVHVARLNSNGSLDTTFNPSARIVDGGFSSIELQTDGKIIIAGGFEIIDNGIIRNDIARLNIDGSLDNSFNVGTGTNFLIDTLAIQTDGKIIIVGDFTTVNEVNRNQVARLNSNGALDNSFNAGLGIGTNCICGINNVAIQTNGKILVGGSFTRFNGINQSGLVRLLNDSSVQQTSKFDFDGDGKADIAVFRPSSGAWFLQQSTAGFTAVGFGLSTDLIAPADFDGDGKTDISVFRPSNGTWFLLQSQAGFAAVQFGQDGDIPTSADYDGDGKSDIAVFRPANGTWYLLRSRDGFLGVQFGQNGDKPAAADYDGDGKTDIAVVRQTNGASIWYILGSSQGFYGIQFGTDTDKPTPADFDGDGKTDIAVFRPSNGVWYLLRSQQGFTGVSFGTAEDKPAAADYDGDGKADVAVFRPSNGVWYLLNSQSGFTAVQFGTANDRPIPAAFVP